MPWKSLINQEKTSHLKPSRCHWNHGSHLTCGPDPGLLTALHTHVHAYIYTVAPVIWHEGKCSTVNSYQGLGSGSLGLGQAIPPVPTLKQFEKQRKAEGEETRGLGIPVHLPCPHALP